MSVASWAPGRVNLIGEHTDYSGGLVLPFAIQLGVGVEVLEESGRLDLVSEAFGPASEPWGRYAEAVAAELDALGRPAAWFRGRIRSTVPAGAGLASSAALGVAVAVALCAVADWSLPPLELAEACRRAEVRAVGTPVGILDQAACVLAREGHAVLVDCGSLEHRLVRLPDEWAVVVADSGVQHVHEESGYATRRAELEAGLPARVRHVRSENARVLAFVDALERRDLPAAGELLLASHTSLRDDYEVSTPELDALVERAVASGAAGARLVGGGFGGSILALAETARAAELAAELGGFVARACSGAGVRSRAA